MNGTPKELSVRRARVRTTNGPPRKTRNPPLRKRSTIQNQRQQKLKSVPQYYPSKTGHHAHSPSADQAAYYRGQDHLSSSCSHSSTYDSDSDSENERHSRGHKHKHKHKHKHHCCCGDCCDCCDVPPQSSLTYRQCGWYPEAPCLGNCCGGYYDGLNGYVVYDTGNPFCTSRPGAYVSPNPLIPWTNALPYSNLCSPCGNYGTEWDASDPRPPPIPAPGVVPIPYSSKFGKCGNFCYPSFNKDV